MTEITIKINNEEYQASPGEMIIQVADRNNIHIPRFCYHKHLSVAANCRMCLVEIKKAPKPLVACATPVADGMEIFTKSTIAKESQKSTMEFLLINHPLDCPICDQGGECELQDMALGYGSAFSDYEEDKRVVPDQDLGPLISTDMTRCIHCTRCVRFGQEVSLMTELGATGRGEDMKIGTYVSKTIDSELSGNMIDLCPVGALNSKPFKMKARSWEMQSCDSVAPHDGVGSKIFIHTLRNRVMRVVPKEDQRLNKTWLSDRDRFSYTGLYDKERIESPEIKINGIWKKISWNTALDKTHQHLKHLIEESRQNQLGVLVGATSTTEDAFALKTFFNALGFDNIDYRLRYRSFGPLPHTHLKPSLMGDLSELENFKTIFSFGSNIRKDYPMLSLAVQSAVMNPAVNAKFYAMHNRYFEYNYPSQQLNNKEELLAYDIYTLIKIAETIKGVKSQFNFTLTGATTVEYDKSKTKLMEGLIKNLCAGGEQSVILCSSFLSHHPKFSTITLMLEELARICQTKFVFLTAQINENGMRAAECFPSNNASMNIQQMLEALLSDYFIFNTEPELDSSYPALSKKALLNAKNVISFNSYASPLSREYSNILLPLAGFSEISGSYINTLGEPLYFSAATTPFTESKEGWKVFRALADTFSLSNINWSSTTDLQSELQKKLNIKLTDTAVNGISESELKQSNIALAITKEKEKDISLVSQWGVHQIDSVVRRAAPLQETADGKNDQLVFVSQDIADKYLIKTGSKIELTIEKNKCEVYAKVSTDIPVGCVSLFLGTSIAESIHFHNQDISIRLLT